MTFDAAKTAVIGGALETLSVRLGIIPLSDCAPIAIAKEKGFFRRWGLDVVVTREASWANIRDKVAIGALDGGHMLAAMPLVSIAGFLWLGATPTLAALVAFGVTRRVGEFAISKPSREALFTIVPREERYKAKNFIDTVVYRGGDAASGWIFAGPAAFLAAGVSVAWAALAFYLGSRMKSWTRAGAPS